MTADRLGRPVLRRRGAAGALRGGLAAGGGAAGGRAGGDRLRRHERAALGLARRLDLPGRAGGGAGRARGGPGAGGGGGGASSGRGGSRNLGSATALPRPAVADVVYAPHAYDADAEAGRGFDPAHRDAVLANGVAPAGEAAALWIGEYGGDPDPPGIVAYMDAEYDAAAAVAGSTMYWDYVKGGYGLLAADGSERTALTDALVRPYPERVAGDPVAYAFDEATRTF